MKCKKNIHTMTVNDILKKKERRQKRNWKTKLCCRFKPIKPQGV